MPPQGYQEVAGTLPARCRRRLANRPGEQAVEACPQVTAQTQGVGGRSVPSFSAPAPVTLQLVGDPVTIETTDITSEESSQLSIMPEGQLDNLDDFQVRSLFRFLMAPAPPQP